MPAFSIFNFFFVCFYGLFAFRNACAQNLIAYISQRGLHGEITFRQLNQTHVVIETRLKPTLQYPNQVWKLALHEFPVDYTNVNGEERCDLNNLGPEILRFFDESSYLVLPDNATSVWFQKMQLSGPKGVWGKSLVLTEATYQDRICAAITVSEAGFEHMAEARFNTPIAGSVFFRSLGPANGTSGDSLIYADLYHIQAQAISEPHEQSFTNHHWKIFVTDILGNDRQRTEDNCNFLQLVFDPHGNGEGKGIGDLDSRLGEIKVAKNALKLHHKAVFHDENLLLLPSDLTISHRKLYLVLFDNRHPDNFLACARIRPTQMLVYKTFPNFGGIKGEITFSQRSKFDPTFLNFIFNSVNEAYDKRYLRFLQDIVAIKIHTLPPAPGMLGKHDYCDTTSKMYNPRNVIEAAVPPSGYGTQDQYAVGDLSGKLENRNEYQHPQYVSLGKTSVLSGLYWDTFLPLQGLSSIAHRSLVIYTYDRTDFNDIKPQISACSTINQYEKNGVYQKPMLTAQILFRYPIVGRVLLRQTAEEPWQDTIILFDYLIHADGSNLNTTHNHRWAIHSSPPTKDFYSWKDRCLSVGHIYNPFKVDWGANKTDNFCESQLPAMCRLGSLDKRCGKLSIAGHKMASNITRRMFVDTNLPLTGSHSIIGKSLVIYDDFGPQARGERLACSSIMGLYRRKVVAKDWYTNKDESSVNGKIEIIQQTEYDITNIEIQLKGLKDSSNYHIHMNPVESNLIFPCEASSLYGRYNPLGVAKISSPPAKHGTTDQYAMGDLSGKFGTLDGAFQYERTFNDTQMPLFGYNSIIGRSLVIHKKEKNEPWACSTLERGYSPNEARELRAIASFHHPEGFAYGYIKMSQLISADGSQSETTIEVKLRHPGVNDRNRTRNHNWQIFVNPVGVDATVKTTLTRCVAAGYVWDPFYTQLADPLNHELYEKECGPDNPLRCRAGDVGSRLGTIDLGGDRKVFTDINLPLEGSITAVGRSVVLFDAENSHVKYACANIEPDHDIFKYVNLEKPPTFIVAKFLEELRAVMGVPEWMIVVDARRTKELHGGQCVQMIIHFKGPIAHQLEKDMSKLLGAGRLDSPSLYIPSYSNSKRKPTLSYRVCGARDLSDTQKFLRRGKNPNGYFSSQSSPRMCCFLKMCLAAIFCVFLINTSKSFAKL